MNIERKTKIIATLGPATFNTDMIRKLITEGVNIFRLNFSHIDYQTAERVIKDIRGFTDELRKPIGILVDLQGPKIRIGTFKNGSVNLTEGQVFTITTEIIEGDEHQVSTSLKNLPQDAKIGDKILLDDGKIVLEVIDKTPGSVLNKVITGGVLSNKKGMNLPGMKLSTSALTDKDKQDALFAIKHNVDYLALSFVRKGSDIDDLKKILTENNSPIKVIAKIEKPEAVENLDEIIEKANALMVARGDLGIEVSVEKVPQLQKDIIKKANSAGKPVIVATQMLESMINNPLPTRAEVSDVATAIFDWADAVMLSGETAAGKYPCEAVRFMSKIATNTDIGQSERKKNLRVRKASFLDDKSMVSAICDSADQLVDVVGATAIMTFSSSGKTALLLSKYRSSTPIIAITDQPHIYTMMTLLRGVCPLLCKKAFDKMSGIKEMLIIAETLALEQKLVKEGDKVIMTAGIPIATSGSTNMIRIHTVGEPLEH